MVEAGALVQGNISRDVFFVGSTKALWKVSERVAVAAHGNRECRAWIFQSSRPSTAGLLCRTGIL